MNRTEQRRQARQQKQEQKNPSLSTKEEKLVVNKLVAIGNTFGTNIKVAEMGRPLPETSFSYQKDLEILRLTMMMPIITDSFESHTVRRVFINFLEKTALELNNYEAFKLYESNFLRRNNLVILTQLETPYLSHILFNYLDNLLFRYDEKTPELKVKSAREIKEMITQKLINYR